MLSRDEILTQIEFGNIKIDPFNRGQLGANSYDVLLAPTMYRVIDEVLDLKKEYRYETFSIFEDGVFLYPNELYLGCTVEKTYSPRHIPQYNGRSTIGRYFIQSHMCAGFGDLGYNGYWTLEIVVMRKVKVYPRMKIGQICFYSPEGFCSYKEYGDITGNYNNDICLPKIAKCSNF